ncbi:MAG: hypothetical protein ACFCU7_15925 [Pleurocapsa sp.]
MLLFISVGDFKWCDRFYICRRLESGDRILDDDNFQQRSRCNLY